MLILGVGIVVLICTMAYAIFDIRRRNSVPILLAAVPPDDEFAFHEPPPVPKKICSSCGLSIVGNNLVTFRIADDLFDEIFLCDLCILRSRESKKRYDVDFDPEEEGY